MEFLTEEEAARLTGKKPRTFRQKVIAGTIPITYRSVCGRHYQYCEKGLKKYLDSVTVKR